MLTGHEESEMTNDVTHHTSEEQADRGREMARLLDAAFREAEARAAAIRKRAEETRERIRQGARGPHKGAFRL